MSQYQIIDEPKVKPQQHLIVNPIVILLVGILVPLVWTPPLYGRIWGTLLWIIANGYLLGSPTFKSEVFIAIVGGICWFALPYGVVFILFETNYQAFINVVVPYLRIANNGVFFLTLYLIVFRQAVPYELFCYFKDKGNR